MSEEESIETRKRKLMWDLIRMVERLNWFIRLQCKDVTSVEKEPLLHEAEKLGNRFTMLNHDEKLAFIARFLEKIDP